MDLPNPKNQEKQTGFPNFCEKHKRDLGNYAYCTVCDKEDRKEEQRKAIIEEAQKVINILPERLRVCSFDTYAPVCQKSEDALKKCKEFAETFKGGGLVLLGAVGTGKTHLSIAVCKAGVKMGIISKFTTVTDIIRKVRATWNTNSTDTFGTPITEETIINEYSNADLLVIDEIGSQYGSDSEKIIISEIINKRYNNMLPTIITGNVTLSQAKEYLGERAIDRIKHGGKIISFDWESYRK